MIVLRVATVALCAAATAFAATTRPPRPACARRDPPSPEALHTRDYFYIGGRYVDMGQGHVLTDQMYVEKLSPECGSTQKHPIVMIHGGGTSGMVLLNTPDNRQGWASWFLEQGYEIYLLDVVGGGRSSDNDLASFKLFQGATAELTTTVFTAPERYNQYPQAKLHNQWPGTGAMGDPVFDAFMGNNIPLTSNFTRQQDAMKNAGCQLLKKIGQAFVLAHSLSAVYGTIFTDTCPESVVANVALEPDNSPFVTYDTGKAQPARDWALANIPLTFDPPAKVATDLKQVEVGTDSVGNHSCQLQADPPRKLPNVAKVPALVVTTEASIHITYDHCEVAFLRQAGVNTDWIQLADKGVHGNGHYSFLEKNNIDVVKVIEGWIKDHA